MATKFDDFWINTDDDRVGERIRIKVILLGETVSDLIWEHMPDNVNFYQITQKDEIRSYDLEAYLCNADIVILVADLSDNFAAENICSITEVFHRNRVLSIGVIANTYALPDCEGVLDSSVLVVEKQTDSTLQAEPEISKKIWKTTFFLLKLIDNEIYCYRILDESVSALITLQSVFESKGELQLYMVYDYNDLKKVLADDAIFRMHLEQASKVWVKFDSAEGSLEDVADFMEILERVIDEDANLYFDSGNDVKINKVTILLKYDELITRGNFDGERANH